MNQDLKDEIASLKQEIGSLRKAINKKKHKTKFDIDDFKHSNKDILFSLAFPNMILCYYVLIC